MTDHSSPENADVSAVRKVSEKVGDIVRELLDCGFDEAIELIDTLTKERDAAEAALRIRAQCVPSREAALEAAALDFIAKVDRGEARSRKSYAAFKAALSFTSPEHQSAPAYAAAHNSGEGDPSVMPDYVGADTAILPQCVRAALQTIKDICAGDRVPNWKDDWQTTHSRGRILDLCDAALAHTRPECGDGFVKDQAHRERIEKGE